MVIRIPVSISYEKILETQAKTFEALPKVISLQALVADQKEQQCHGSKTPRQEMPFEFSKKRSGCFVFFDTAH